MIRLQFDTLRIIQTIKLAILASSLIVSNVTLAESVRREADGDDSTRKAQYMLKQMAQEKAALQTEKAKLQNEVDELSSKVKGLEKSLEKNKKTLTKSKDKNTKLVSRINRDHEHIQALQGKYRETVSLLQASNADNAHLINAVQERNQWIDTCRTRNNQMFEANTELLDQYVNKGFVESMSQREPITQIGSVKVENEVQEYQFRLEDLHMNQFVSNESTVDAHR